MRNLAELNINEGGRTVSRGLPTARALEQLESEFGLALPTGLRELLEFANGGHPELDAVDGESGDYAVNQFYHLVENDHGTESIWYAVEHWQPVLGRSALPFANDAGGNQFFLDMSSTPPPVKLCLHAHGFRVVDVAPTFEAFIDSLQLDPDID